MTQLAEEKTSYKQWRCRQASVSENHIKAFSRAVMYVWLLCVTMALQKCVRNLNTISSFDCTASGRQRKHWSEKNKLFQQYYPFLINAGDSLTDMCPIEESVGIFCYRRPWPAVRA